MTIRSPDRPRDGVHELPLNSGERSPAWTGVVLLAVIELMVVGALIASWFYLRVGTAQWPPADAGMPDLVLGGAGQLLLTLSALPVWLSERAYRHHADERPLRRLFPLALLMVGAYAALKCFEYAKVSYRWSSHAYGSISWTLTGYQLLHAAVLIVFGLVVWGFVRGHDLKGQRNAAVECVALYWYFLVASSLLEFLTTHVSPYLL